MNFDFDRTLSLEGNTAPYLMYSYARCRSLQRGGVQSPSVDALAAREPVERALLLRLARFPEAVQTSLENHRPNILCEALFETANAFNRFYKEVRVLGAEDRVVKEERLALVSSARVLARARYSENPGAGKDVARNSAPAATGAATATTTGTTGTTTGTTTTATTQD